MNDTANTLVILSPGFPENEADTTCIPPQQVFVKLLKKEYPALHVIVIAFQYPFLETEYLWKGVRVIALNGRNGGNINRAIVWRKAWKTLKRIRKEHRVVGIFSFWCGECALIGKWFGKKYFIKHHCWILGQDARKENNYIKWIRPAGHDLVALSDFIAREFHKNHGIAPCSVIPIGIDPEMFDTTPVEKDIDVLGVGSLIPLKNFELFLHAIHQCRKQLPGIKAVICGKGPEEENLKETILMFNLAENVCLAGEKEHPEVLRLMRRAKVFLHTSYYEGLGAVCLEALYGGARVISFVEPMERKIQGWHIVKSSREMIREILGNLQQSGGDLEGKNFSPGEGAYTDSFAQAVLEYSMSDSVKEVMELFNYNETAI